MSNVAANTYKCSECNRRFQREGVFVCYDISKFKQSNKELLTVCPSCRKEKNPLRK